MNHTKLEQSVPADAGAIRHETGSMNRLYNVLSGINHIICHARTRQLLFDEACRIAVERGNLSAAFIATADQEGNIRFPSKFGRVVDYLDGIKIKLKGANPGDGGIIATILTTGHRAIRNDIANDPDLKPWRQVSLERGFRAGGGFPLKVKDETIAALVLCADTVGFFNDQEVQLLDEVAARLSFGADFIEKERQRLEAVEALREKERMVSTLLANLPGMAYRCRVGKRWTMEFVSEGCQELTGYAPSSLLMNKTVSYAELIHPEDLASLRSEVDAAIAEHRKFQLTYRIRTASGVEKWVSEQGVAISNAGGAVTWIEGFTSDITESKKLDLRIRALSDLGLKLSAARNAVEAAETLVETARKMLGCDACSVQIYSEETDRMHHVLHRDTLNGVYQKTGPPRNNTPPSDLARKVMKEGAQLILKKYPAGPTPGSLPFGDVSKPSASIIFAPIRNGSKPVGFVSLHSYSFDAYDAQSLQTLQALADYCGGAWDRIQAQENLQAVEEQLRHSQKMDAIGQLAGGVAHDFNNLLTVMMGNADLALKDPAGMPPLAKTCLTQIIAASERAASLTRQLLTFGRKQVMQAGPIVLNDVISNLTSMLDRIIGEHITLECNYDPSPSFVQADGGMIEQVLVNLVVNARDAMPDGGSLRIETRTVTLEEKPAGSNPNARPGRFSCITVRDTGCGIAPEDLPRIFEPFFTTKEAGKGTGLGLATVYGIVKQHEGWIEVASRPGEGAAFTIYFPVLAQPQPRKQSSAAGNGNARGSETILLVEDEPAVRMVSRRVLEMGGYKVLEATSGAEALEVWRKHSPQIKLLVTDIVMPGGLNGGELAEKLKAERPGLKTIFMSGYSPSLIGKGSEFFRQAGANFLQKPCSTKLLLETVRNTLNLEQDAEKHG